MSHTRSLKQSELFLRLFHSDIHTLFYLVYDLLKKINH